MFSKMGYSAGKFLATDLSGLSYTNLSGNFMRAIEGFGTSGFISQELDVRDTNVLLVIPTGQPQNTSGDNDLEFGIGYSPDNKNWTDVSHLPVTVNMNCFGSGVAGRDNNNASGFIIGWGLLDVESVGYARLQSLANTNTSTAVNSINCYWGKGW